MFLFSPHLIVIFTSPVISSAEQSALSESASPALSGSYTGSEVVAAMCHWEAAE